MQLAVHDLVGEVHVASSSPEVVRRLCQGEIVGGEESHGAICAIDYDLAMQEIEAAKEETALVHHHIVYLSPDRHLGGTNYIFADGHAKWLKLQQKWNDKWTTFQRFVKADHAFKAGFEEGPGDIDVTNWTLGIKYYYTPNLSFELVYDNVDYGNGWIGSPTFDPIDDSLIRLRTHVAF